MALIGLHARNWVSRREEFFGVIFASVQSRWSLFYNTCIFTKCSFLILGINRHEFEVNNYFNGGHYFIFYKFVPYFIDSHEFWTCTHDVF